MYVDSGSSDNSVSFARSLGIPVVELDSNLPFTAARARNAGFDAVLNLHATVEFVQFVDGDCELFDDWINKAIQALSKNPNVAIVSGRRIERYPEASIYNALMDIEWNTPIGETKAVLGDMCFRVSAFKEVGGFSNDVIAAEDDDICIRTRLLGYKILRLDGDMSMHDANILTWSQWHLRQKRGGFAFAAVYDKYHKSGEAYFLKELIRVVVWAAVIPTALLLSILVEPRLAILIVMAVTILIARTIFKRRRLGSTLRVSCGYAVSVYIGKFSEFSGVLEYLKRKFERQPVQLIEYK